MKSHQHRLKTIELSLTPEQIVLARHEAAKEAGSLVDAALISPAPRQAIANAVNNAIRESMKGQPEAVIEGAIQQGRQQADFLFMLIVETNAGVRGNADSRRESYRLVVRHLFAVVRGPAKAEPVEELRLSLLEVIQSLLIDDGVVTRITTERLRDQEVLFPDTSAMLKKQVGWAENLADTFNILASQVAVAKIDLDEIRKGVQSEVDDQVSRWVDLARLGMLLAFGEGEAWREPVKRFMAVRPRPDSGSLSTNTSCSARSLG